MRTIELTGWRATLCAGLLLLPGVSLAWDGTPTGFISAVEVNPGVQAFRVYMTNVSVMCGSNSWAYLSVTDSNYNAMAATLLSAKVAGTSVTLYLTLDGSSYCHIGDIIAS
jgi:hypothetical protein